MVINKMVKSIIIYFLIVSISGTILHFTYKLSKKNIIVGIFSAVNESVWEHIKLFLTPIFILNTIRYIFISKENYFFSLAVELFLAIFLTILLYKIKVFIYKEKNNFLNILSFYIVALIISVLRCFLFNIEVPSAINIASSFICLIIFIMYLTFSVFPPKNDLFLDHTTNTYGVN